MAQIKILYPSGTAKTYKVKEIESEFDGKILKLLTRVEPYVEFNIIKLAAVDSSKLIFTYAMIETGVLIEYFKD